MIQRLPIPFLIASVLLAVSACTSPDPEGRHNEFAANTADLRLDAGDTSVGGGVVIDFSGTFFFSFSTVVDFELPIFFEATVVVDMDALTIDLTLQALKTDLLLDGTPREDARAYTGDPIVMEGIPYEEDGTFITDLGTVTMSGDANGITGRDIVAEITLAGRVDTADFFCGSVEGDVTFPVPIDLAGSTFGATRTEPDQIADLDVVNAPMACPGSGDTGDASTPDAGE